MKVNGVNVSELRNNVYLDPNSTLKVQKDNKFIGNSYKLSNDLSLYAFINKSSIVPISFNGLKHKNNNYELMSLEELRERTSPERFSYMEMLTPESESYNNLSDGDQEALKHLVKASRHLNNVFLVQDNVHNIPVKKYLEAEAANGDERAELTLKLFNAQLGINAKDTTSKPVQLVKGLDEGSGKGFYPEDLSKEEFHEILINMLNAGEDKEVEKILNQRSMVERDGYFLKATDYTDYFKDDFEDIAFELIEAATTSTDEDFNKYLYLQAMALLHNDPQIDANADKLWAKLQDTPLEFTITRESYDDKMTPSVNENEKLKKLLDERNIVPYSKDSLGIRVGIVDKEGTEKLLEIKKYLPLMAKNMPYNDEYEQNVSGKKNLKQTMVDINVVDMAGHNAAYRGGIGIASNLPNNDKLAVMQGGGHRNVYHKQIREARYNSDIDAKLGVLLEPSQHEYFDSSTLHDFTILHENVHSLGPKTGAEKLGVLKNTIEENKADMGAITMLKPLEENGFYSSDKVKKIITSYLVAYVPKGPDFENAHRRRNIMQYNYFIQNGAIDVDETGMMSINYDKVVPTAKKMLSDVIRIQIDGDMEKAEDFVNNYSVWTKELDLMGENVRKLDKNLNSGLLTPLGDMLANE